MRFMFMIILFVTQAFCMFGCGATMHSESTLHSEVDTPYPMATVMDESDAPYPMALSMDEGHPLQSPPVQTERTTQRESFASSMPAACDSHRARYVHRGVSTRDGMRVYCF